MVEILEELQLFVRCLGQIWSAERLHDLSYSDGLSCKLILCATL